MRSGNEKPTGNTLCIAKGFEAAWMYFCPSKPCVSLSSDGLDQSWSGLDTGGTS